MDNKQANPEVPKNEDAGNSRRGFGAKVTAVFLGIAAFTGPVCAAGGFVFQSPEA